jgi:outer membrane protein assembly factor BamB
VPWIWVQAINILGDEVWRSELPNPGASPALLENYNFGIFQFSLLYMVSQQWSSLVAYNLSNGHLIWETPLPAVNNLTDVTGPWRFRVLFAL